MRKNLSQLYVYGRYTFWLFFIKHFFIVLEYLDLRTTKSYEQKHSYFRTIVFKLLCHSIVTYDTFKKIADINFSNIMLKNAQDDN